MSGTTFFPSELEIERDWWIADAEGQVLGRLATAVTGRLRGKTKTQYTPFLDTGDFVVIVNAEKVKLTGRKLEQKVYYRHSGYPGGIKSATAAERLEREPARMVRDAVEGMLPHNKLGRRMIKKLKVYTGPDHPHAAQQPKPMPARSKSATVAGTGESR